MIKNFKQMKISEINKFLLKKGFQVVKYKKFTIHKDLKSIYFTTTCGFCINIILCFDA